MLANIAWPTEVLRAARKTLDCSESALGHIVTAAAVVAWATWIGMYVFRLRLPKEVTIRRKFREWLVALQLERLVVALGEDN